MASSEENDANTLSNNGVPFRLHLQHPLVTTQHKPLQTPGFLKPILVGSSAPRHFSEGSRPVAYRFRGFRYTSFRRLRHKARSSSDLLPIRYCRLGKVGVHFNVLCDELDSETGSESLADRLHGHSAAIDNWQTRAYSVVNDYRNRLAYREPAGGQFVDILELTDCLLDESWQRLLLGRI